MILLLIMRAVKCETFQEQRSVSFANNKKQHCYTRPRATGDKRQRRETAQGNRHRTQGIAALLLDLGRREA